jgi:predicted DNA-binding transcriptional regulator YafY
VFRQRWYVIGKNTVKNALRTYSLDRVQRIEVIKQSFKLPKAFDPAEYFSESFGIIVDEEVPPCVVRLKAYNKQADYIRTLPLHTSQEEIETTEEYAVFSYYIAPTFDFVQEILSRGSEVEVLAPEELRNEIADKAAQMVERYQMKKQ